MDGISPDSLFPPWPHVFQSAVLLVDEHRLKVTWSDGTDDIYPLRWLRFVCPCSECWNPTIYSRKHSQLKLEAATTVSVQESGRILKVQWESGHESNFGASFLGNRVFREDRARERRKFMSYDFPPIKFQESSVLLRRFDFNELVTQDEQFLDFCEHIQEYGASLVTGSPVDAYDRLLKERNIIARGTNYGSYYWDVKTKQNASNLAYTPAPLDLHTDLPLFDKPPEIQFLHCIKSSTEGGESMLSDGIQAAEKLRQNQPDYFGILSTKCMDFSDLADDVVGPSYLACRHPVIELDHDGVAIKQIHFNTAHFANIMCESLEDTELYMEALEKLKEYFDEGCIQFLLRPGDIMIFNNVRILHGRAAFRMNTTGKVMDRHLRGFYTDWDYLRSAVRICKAAGSARKANE